RIDIFDPEGFYIAESEIGDPSGPGSLAIDSKGNLYVANRFNDNKTRVVRYSPTQYEPEERKIKYNPTPSVIVEESASTFMGVAVNPANDHLLVKFEVRIKEYKSAAESPSNDFLQEIGVGELSGDGVGIAVDAARGRLYASTEGAEGHVIKAFGLSSPHETLFTIKPP